jgi:hypothetical protein
MEPDTSHFAPYLSLETDEMRAAACRELEALWKALGPHVRGHRRDERASEVWCFRRQVKPTLASVASRYDHLSFTAEDYQKLLELIPGLQSVCPMPAFHQLCAARRTIKEKAWADFEREVTTRPIDDEAWAKELQRRADHEKYRARIRDYLTRPEARFERWQHED